MVPAAAAGGGSGSDGQQAGRLAASRRLRPRCRLVWDASWGRLAHALLGGHRGGVRRPRADGCGQLRACRMFESAVLQLIGEMALTGRPHFPSKQRLFFLASLRLSLSLHLHLAENSSSKDALLALGHGGPPRAAGPPDSLFRSSAG